MPFRIVQSKQNARLKQLRGALRAGRKDGAPAGIEGPNLLAEALRARLRIPAVFVAQGAENLLDDFKLKAETEILVVPKLILNSALTTETPQPIAALVEPPDWTWAHLLGSEPWAAPLVVVLCGLQDPGNLGTILRSAEAFGATGIISLPGTVSAWNPKAVRASAGSVFRVPLLAVSEDECLTELREAGARTLTATTASTAKFAAAADLRHAVALLIGNEGNGVPADLAAKADGAITIPCPGPVESLNAAVAASVLLYEASRQRLEAKAQEQRRGAQR